MNERIEINPLIHHGRPVIKGTRVPVIRLLACMAGGMTLAETAEEYGVTVEDVVAAIDFASELVEQAQQRPVAAR